MTEVIAMNDMPPAAGPAQMLTEPEAAQRRVLVFHRINTDAAAGDHDPRTKSAVAQALAGLLGCTFGGDFDAASTFDRPPYFVPSDTLTSVAQAQRLGIHDATDLFGGVVPFAFVATKVISHPLVAADSVAPAGWSADYCERVHDVVLPGHSAFSIADARHAGRLLLADGAVRMKDPGGVGGVGQWVVRSADELDAQLASFDAALLQRHGIVLERNLKNVVTHSVGQVRVGPWLATYHGTQHTTRNHRGHDVYGGSDLVVVRGGFDELLQRQLTPAVRTAVEQALVYHSAAAACFDGWLASRCNYDVAQGTDDGSGIARSGVLEQSWRIGGASGAEVAALQAFRANPGVQIVRASTCEHYGDDLVLPPGAWVLYDGTDRHFGRLTKYVEVAPHVDG